MAKKPTPKGEATQPFAVLSLMRFNGSLYGPDDMVEMAPAEAEPLVAAGVLAASPADPAKPAEPPAQ